MPVQGTTLTSLRPLMQGTNGMVVASHPSAAMAGLDVLRNGGNAIELAGNGFPMYRYLAGRFKTAFDQYNTYPSTAEIFLPGGRPPEQREMFYQRDLAATLAKVTEVEDSNKGQGREAALKASRDYIYTGELGRKIAAYNQEMGGLLTEEDLARYHVQVAPPVSVNYRGYDVYSTGPWGQGPTFPQALKILEGFDLASMGHNSAEYIHTLSQALNLAFADREQYVGDPDFVDVPIDELLSAEYLARRRSLIDPDLAWPGTPPPGDPLNGKATLNGAPQSPHEAAVPVGAAGVSGGGTSFFAVIDRNGTIFSSTPSEGTKNGGPIIPGTGLAFHGGDHIPQGTLQLLMNVLEFGRDPQEAVEEPRFYSYNFPSSNTASKYEPGMLRLEGRIPDEVAEKLEQKGHTIERYPDWWEGSALYCVITRDPTTKVLQGGADPRCEAYAMGY